MLIVDILGFLYLSFEGLYSAIDPIIEFMNYQIPILNDITVGAVIFGGGFVTLAIWRIVNWIIPG